MVDYGRDLGQNSYGWLIDMRDVWSLYRNQRLSAAQRHMRVIIVVASPHYVVKPTPTKPSPPVSRTGESGTGGCPELPIFDLVKVDLVKVDLVKGI